MWLAQECAPPPCPCQCVLGLPGIPAGSWPMGAPAHARLAAAVSRRAPFPAGILARLDSGMASVAAGRLCGPSPPPFGGSRRWVPPLFSSGAPSLARRPAEREAPDRGRSGFGPQPKVRAGPGSRRPVRFCPMVRARRRCGSRPCPSGPGPRPRVLLPGLRRVGQVTSPDLGLGAPGSGLGALGAVGVSMASGICPLAANRIAHWRPIELPTGGQQFCPVAAIRVACGSVGQWRHPLSGGGLGEADAVAGGGQVTSPDPRAGLLGPPSLLVRSVGFDASRGTPDGCPGPVLSGRSVHCGRPRPVPGSCVGFCRPSASPGSWLLRWLLSARLSPGPGALGSGRWVAARQAEGLVCSAPPCSPGSGGALRPASPGPALSSPAVGFGVGSVGPVCGLQSVEQDLGLGPARPVSGIGFVGGLRRIERNPRLTAPGPALSAPSVRCNLASAGPWPSAPGSGQAVSVRPVGSGAGSPVGPGS